VEKMGLEPTTS